MVVYLVIAAVVLSGLLIFFYPRWRRRRLLSKPFPAAWLRIVKNKLAFYPKLEAAEQQQLQDMIRLFVADKKYFGCGGLQITDEIKITIAAEACLLLLNRYSRIYPDLHYILVYPDAFKARHDARNADGTLSAVERGLLGESWQNGKVILSWDDVQKGVADFSDGHNVVLHEFSHQLDSENGAVNGAPVMRSNRLKTWARVFTAEFADLSAAVEQHEPAVMDYYGATNPAEFFAVATETFYEKPVQMQQRHPQLYAQLREYYQVDPQKWL